jgi:DNA-binding beta-propeller fold protein YncE
LKAGPQILKPQVWLEGIEGVEGLAMKEGVAYATSTAHNGSLVRIRAGRKPEVMLTGLEKPDNLLFHPDGTLLLSIEEANGPVFKISGSQKEALIEKLNRPEGMAFDSKGNLFIVEDAEPGRLLKWDGQSSAVLRDDLMEAENLAVDEADNLYITESGKGRVLKRNPAGEFSVFFEGLNDPDGIAYCKNCGGLLVTEDAQNGRLILIRSGHREETLLSGLYFPQTVTESDGAIYVTERGHHRILRLETPHSNH